MTSRPPAPAGSSRLRFGWFGLVQIAAVVETALLLGAGVYLRDAEALTLAFIVLLTLGWILFRPGRILPVVVRALVFADVAIWMAPAAVSNATNQGSFGSVAVPVALATTAITGLIASAGFVLARGSVAAGRAPASVVAAIAVFVIAALSSYAAATSSSRAALPAGALTISATNARFSTTTLTGNRGTVTIDFSNNDLFWHTFTITELGVDIRAPVKGHRQVSFRVAPGTYTFFCAIPGHRQIGMHGTLIIQ